MPPEHRCHPAPAHRRLPRRGTDWVEDIAVWLGLLCAVVGVCGALAIGSRVQATALGEAKVAAAERVPVVVELVGDVPYTPDPSGKGLSTLVRAPVQWVGRDGVGHTGELPVRGPLADGQHIPAWTDRAGRLVTAPLTAFDARLFAIFAVCLVLIGEGSVLALAWYGLTRVLLAVDYRRWGREWAAVEPLWSGRSR
jgi:hypothetical protein